MKRPSKFPIYLSIAEKTNKLLSGIVIAFGVIALRLWYLAVVEHEQKLEEAYKPQIRMIPQYVERATICDRFGKALATNQLQYNVSIAYGAIRDLPARAWRLDKEGKKQLIPVRKHYIYCLSELLSQELHLDREIIEDAIHAKASVLGSVPYLLAANVSERTYLKLKMLSKDWPGLHVEAVVRRYYPQGSIASDILGYVGPISPEEYKRVTQELSRLRECIRAYEEGEDPKLPEGLGSIDQVRALLESMESNAYSLNALVGKMGVEAQWDSKLRGKIGKKTILVDRRGNFIQEMEGAILETPGTRLQLALSTELQAYADSLLLEYERTDSFRSAKSLKKQEKLPPLFPWIKGGAIIALDPNNGEVLAMASSPRYRNNDFVNVKVAEDSKGLRSSIYRWLENKEHIAEIYDRKVPLCRERRHPLTGLCYEEILPLTFDCFLDFLFPEHSIIKLQLKTQSFVGQAIEVQNSVNRLLALFSYQEGNIPSSAIFDAVFPDTEGHILIREVISVQQQKWIAECLDNYRVDIEEIKEELYQTLGSFSANYEKILYIDLLRLIIDPRRFSSTLPPDVYQLSLSQFAELQGRYVVVRAAFSSILQDVFNEVHFKLWRKTQFPEYLANKRKEEALRRQRYPTPYVDYLEEEKTKQYRAFCQEHLDEFLAYLFAQAPCKDGLQPYYDVLDLWINELDHGAHRALSWYESYVFLKERLSNLLQYLPSLFSTFREFSDLQRSLLGKYPTTILRNKVQIEQDLAAAFYPVYGYGYLRPHAYGQAATLGSIFKLVSAYSVLSQRILWGHSEDSGSPLTIIDKNSFGYRSTKPHVGFFKDGTPIPTFFRGGSLPGNDFLGRGFIDLVSALEMSSNPFFSLLVGECLADPEDLADAASLFGFGEKTGVGLPGEYAGRVPHDLAYNRSGLYAAAIGQHTLVVTPLQTAVMLASLVNGGIVYVPKLLLGEWEGETFCFQPPIKKRTIFMPDSVVETLKTGMRNVIWGQYGTARAIQSQFPPQLLQRVIGKTSTAESIMRVGLDREYGTMKMKDVWFAAIGFADQDLSIPTIVVVVYLRLGEFGRDAAPMAVKMIDMWEKIQKKENFLQR
ncbi:Penicillin-binding protein H,penicillin-binding protein 2,penicillin-binding protein 2,Penicillin-binding Protein dimerisation domain [Chlamydia serpentis]|uniref:Penicillin-binding protein H,penicillin-binding protein 2,penicillin-binding protein 2,Penicillin-binding Protein dimerisation domain n=1 Tax=Chlamydia serpentis TaxID=1967782 RepID=A0A2R8FBW2_9CHLA|nr:penicillin-binding transpeptidase domain-containing protein [Chlamydia serpentis]SPN73812.1 Penicillin-binding protein H,penicillin-binding protein 2,penicillin-binding protein 2,Penicillin-binding Protein dimerisation domain [Chlamydia serpentis]